MDAFLADESRYQIGLRAPSEAETEGRQATQLTIQLGERDRMSLASHLHHGTQRLEPQSMIPSVILPGDAIPPEATPSMQDIARKLLKALQAEGYGSNVTVAGQSTNVGIVHNELSRMTVSGIQVRQESRELNYARTGVSVCRLQGRPPVSISDQYVTSSAGHSAATFPFLELRFSQHLSSSTTSSSGQGP